MKNPRDLATILREARTARHLTLRERAAAARLHLSFLSLLERGKRRVEPAPLTRVARALGLDPLEILRVAFLERIPPDLRKDAVRGDMDLGAGFEYQTARRLQHQHYPYEIEFAHIA